MPIFSAIAGVVGAISSFIGGLGVIGSFVLKTAVGIGLNLLARSIAGKDSDGPTFSVNGKIQGGGDVPRSFALGWAATAGSLVYQNEWGQDGKTPNAYSTRVIALFDLPTQALVQVMVNGEQATLDAAAHPLYGRPVLEYRKNGKDHLWIKYYDGTQTVADPFLVGTVSSPDRPYEATRVGTGVAYAIATSLVNQELFTGFPEFKFSVTGTKWYDVSKDSTAGGAGAHRWNDPATWGGDGDHLPAVQIYNLLRGINFGGRWFYGLQNVGAARVPAQNFIAQIAKCRAAIQGPSGLQPTFRTGGEIPVNVPIADTVTGLLTGCQGRLAEYGGVYDLHVGAPEAPSFYITDDDILSTEEQSFTPFYGLSDTVNGIAAKCPNPAELWNVKVLPPLYSAEYEAEDGNRRLLADVSLDLVPYIDQAQMLQKTALAEARRARRHTFVLPPKFWSKAVPNITFGYTSARNGYVTKLFRIDGAVDKANLDNLVDITEVDPTDSDWDFNTDFKPMPEGPLGPMRPPVQQMTGWQVFPAIHQIGGKQMPTIRVAYDGDLEDVRDVRVSVRLAGTTFIVFNGTIPYGNPATNENPLSTVLDGVFLPDTNYEVQGQYLPYSGRDTEPSDWLPVKTDNVWMRDLYPVDISRLGPDVKALHEWAASGIREVWDTLNAVSAWQSNQEFANFSDKQELRSEVRSETDKSFAKAETLILAATGPGSALALKIDALEAKVYDPVTGLPAISQAVSSLQTQVTVIDGNVALNSSAITALQASYGDVSGSATFRMATGYTPSAGWTSKIGLQTRINSSGTFRDVGMFLESTATQGRLVISADQFIVVSPGYEAQPLTFVAGVLTLTVGRIGTAIVDLFKTPSNKTQFGVFAGGSEGLRVTV